MTTTADDLAQYVSDGTVTSWITTCTEQATQLVTAYLAAWKMPGVDIPEIVRDRATIEVGSELYHRRTAPNGIKQYSNDLTGAVAAVRVARDPLVGAYPLLNPYTAGGFA